MSSQIKTNIKRAYSAILLSILTLALPYASAQYITEDQRRQNEIRERTEAENAYHNQLVGQRFWFQPGKYMRASFYPAYEVFSDGKLHVSAQDSFTPEKTVSFIVQEYIPSIASRSHLYKVKIEDGTPAYMLVRDFGSYSHGFSNDREFYLTDNERAVIPVLKGSNDKILTRSPEEILARYEEKKQLAAEAEEAKRRAEAQAQIDKDAERKRLIAAVDRQNAANKKKGGVRIGMSVKQVLNSSWGRPEDVNRTTTAAGVSEQWVYGSNSYLYFTNGKLTAIQN